MAQWRQSVLFVLALALLAPALAVGGAGCARDVNVEGAEEPFPTEVRLGMQLRGALDFNTWYYMIFNFTAAPVTSDVAKAPFDFISNEDRGKNWELYVVLKKDQDLGDQLFTLQRPSLPTIFPTAAGPVDAATGQFNPDDEDDSFIDIAVACNGGDRVQLIMGLETLVYNATYFDDAVTIDNGPAPLRIYAADFNDDNKTDLLVIYAGGEEDSAFARVLVNDGLAGFTMLSETPIPGTPVDSLLAEFNPPADAEESAALDLAVLTTDTPGGEGTLRIFLGAGGGSFTLEDSLPVGSDPVAVAAGLLDSEGLDLVVANRGTAATDGSVDVFLGEGLGTFSKETNLPVDGACTGVATGTMFGALADIVFTAIDGSGQGFAGVFHNETDAPFQSTAQTIATVTDPYFVTVLDAGGDNRQDALIVDGAPGSGLSTLAIQRGGREIDTGTQTTTFTWEELPITYPTGNEPARIHIADLDLNGIADFVIPNSGGGENGDSISLFYGLGKNNYTSADVYWTDLPPEPLSTQDWYISHTVQANEFILVIEPALFYDLALLPPEEFIITFMTGTTGINLDDNVELLGEIRDFLVRPFNVPMAVGHFDNEQLNPLAGFESPLPSEDIVSWFVEVN